MLKEKIKSTSGATIMLALLVFLLCAMAGSVILAAATASSGRSASAGGDRGTLLEDEQAYETLASAAHMLEDEIDGQTYSRYWLEGERVENNEPDHSVEKPQGSFSRLLKTAADDVFAKRAAVQEGEDISPYESEKLTIQASARDVTFTDVTASFTMYEDYHIVIELNMDTSARKMVVSIPAAMSQDWESSEILTEEGDRTTCYTDTVIWSDAEITTD